MDNETAQVRVNLYCRGGQRLLTILLKCALLILGCFAVAQAFFGSEPHSLFIKSFAVLFTAGTAYFLFQELHYPGLLSLGCSTLELRGLFGRWTVDLAQVEEVHVGYGEVVLVCTGGNQFSFSHFAAFPELLERLKKEKPAIVCHAEDQ